MRTCRNRFKLCDYGSSAQNKEIHSTASKASRGDRDRQVGKVSNAIDAPMKWRIQGRFHQKYNLSNSRRLRNDEIMFPLLEESHYKETKFAVHN